MIEAKKDLRFLKTEKAIKETFKEMILEKDPSEITISELSERAMIHRKTFYLHYTCIEALFEDVLMDISNKYCNEIDKIPADAPFPEINRVFFEFMAKQEPYVEKMVCAKEYRDLADKMFLANRIHNRSRYNPYSNYSKEEQNIINTFLCETSHNIYRQWIKDGKKVSLEDLIELTGTLFEDGISSVRGKGRNDRFYK